MTSKVIIIMLAVLLVLASTIGVYSYHLTAKIDSLSEELITLREEATASADMVSSLLAAYAQETNTKLDIIDQETNTKLDIIDQEIQNNWDSILASEEAVQRNSDLLSELEGEVVDIVEDLTEKESWLQVDRLYAAVSQSGG